MLPVLDANAMSWLTGVFAPLLAALVAAVVGAAGAIYGVRWEASRAESMAAKESLRRRRAETIQSTHANAVAWLYRLANAVLPEAMPPLRPLPRALDWNVIDTDIRTRIVRFATEMSARKAHSGLTVDDIEVLAVLDYELREAVSAQLERVEADLEPKQFPADAELMALIVEEWSRSRGFSQ